MLTPDFKVVRDIEFELKRIEELFIKYQPLLDRIEGLEEEPDFIELTSLAMFLHSFYNGLENIFSRISKKIDGEVLGSENWHKALLKRMTESTDSREHPVLRDVTFELLEPYLGFRHFTRHAYAFDLEWELMKDLVTDAPACKQNTLEDIRGFIDKIKK